MLTRFFKPGIAIANHAEAPDGVTWSSSPDTQGAFRVTELDQTSSAPAPGAFALVATGLGTLESPAKSLFRG